MREYLESRRLSYKLARKAGWYASSKVDGYDRIVIPCTNSTGLPYYQARAMDSWTNVRYNSPPATRMDSIVCVFPSLPVPVGTVISEGPMDALAAAGAGFLGIGIMGNDPPDRVLDYVSHIVKPFEPVLVVPDKDALSRGAVICGFLAQEKIKTRMLELPGKDLAALSPRRRGKVLEL
jgi:hypothetical protein